MGFERDRLPPADVYFSSELPGLKKKPGDWSLAKCCFHDDKNPSLSVNMITGAFKCFACGASGKDIVDFHKMRYQRDFVEAAKELGAWQ